MITWPGSRKPMRKHHPQNERIKREYFNYLEQAKRMSQSSADQVAAAISQFEQSTSFKDLRRFLIARRGPSRNGSSTTSTPRPVSNYSRGGPHGVRNNTALACRPRHQLLSH